MNRTYGLLQEILSKFESPILRASNATNQDQRPELLERLIEVQETIVEYAWKSAEKDGARRPQYEKEMRRLSDLRDRFEKLALAKPREQGP